LDADTYLYANAQPHVVHHPDCLNHTDHHRATTLSF
jgi:hypothetical protein